MKLPERLAQRGRRRFRRAPPGAAPGVLVVDPATEKSSLRVIAYGPEGIEEKNGCTVEEAHAFVGREPVVWVNVDGLGDAATIEQLGEAFGVHRLALEDVANAAQRPKVEEFDEHLFVVLRMPSSRHAGETEQLALFLGEHYVLTFQERPGDCFDPVRDRLRRGRGRIRHVGPDYLAYALVDAAIDAHFPVLEELSDVLETLETEVIAAAEPASLSAIFTVRRQLLTVRRSIWPQRELLSELTRPGHEEITDDTRVYLRDCYDHVVQLIDLVETQREMASGLMDLYLSSVSNRMNEVMKVLTMIATIFIPLSFVAGLYGMNFDPAASRWNMPELAHPYGYPILLGVMVVVVLVMLWFFRSRGWIGGPRA